MSTRTNDSSLSHNENEQVECGATLMSARVRHVLFDYLDRRAAGEPVTQESVLADHPELLPDLALALKHVRIVGAACEQVAASHTSTIAVRCPNCHASTKVASDSSLVSVTCSDCGSVFSLIDDSLEESTRSGIFGPFELTTRLGGGAFGEVYRARDSRLDRVVALKIPRRGQLGPQDSEQFFREARAAAQLQHPNIVSFYEVGRADDTVYIVSEFIDGTSLAEWLQRQQRVTAREAAALCQKLAAALEHAHAAGVVHRDLKPGNVLMDSAGEPHITDFGLARRETGEVTMTMDGVLVGTPAYMSPEQARGDSHSADARSDVYSLGVILFELVTGELPFRGNVSMVTQQIVNDEPPSPRKLNATVPRDLETITLKCLEKDPARRYGTARELADDLGRFLRGEPIHARPVSRAERTWRWCRRRPLVAGLATVVALLLVTTAAVTTSSSFRSQAAAKAARWQQYLSDMHSAMNAWEESDVGRVVEILERHRPAQGEVDLRRFEWHYLWRQCQPGLSAHTFQNDDGVWAVALSADGSKLVAGTRSSDSAIVMNVWDVERRTRLYSLSGQNAVHSVAISPDDKFFASAGTDPKLCIWDLVTGRSVHKIAAYKTLVSAVAISPDGSLVASSGQDNTAKLWNTKTGELVHIFDTPDMKFCRGALAFAPDGKMLAAGAFNGSVWLWNVPARTPATILHGHSGAARGVAFSRDGQVLATGGDDRIVRLWNPVDGTLKSSLVGHTNAIFAVDFSPDGSTIASAGGRDGTVRVWDAATGSERYCLKGHSGAVNALRYSGNSAVVSGGSDGAVKIWDLSRKYDVNVLRGDTGQTWSIAISRDGKTVAAGGGDGIARLWDLASGALLKTHVSDNHNWINAVALSPDSRQLALGGTDPGCIELWNLVTDEVIRLRDVGSQINSLAWSANGRILVSGDCANQVILWDPFTAREHQRLPGHSFWISWVAISPDDRTLVTRSEDNTLRAWDLPTGALRMTIQIPAYFRSPAVFSADGKLLACVNFDHIIQIRETAGWQIVQSAAGHTDHVKGLAFSPDGGTLASASDDGSIRLWEVSTGEQRCSLFGHQGEVDSVSFTPDGKTLVSSGQDGTVRVWRTGTKEE